MARGRARRARRRRSMQGAAVGRPSCEPSLGRVPCGPGVRSPSNQVPPRRTAAPSLGGPLQLRRTRACPWSENGLREALPRGPAAVALHREGRGDRQRSVPGRGVARVGMRNYGHGMSGSPSTLRSCTPFEPRRRCSRCFAFCSSSGPVPRRLVFLFTLPPEEEEAAIGTPVRCLRTSSFDSSSTAAVRRKSTERMLPRHDEPPTTAQVFPWTMAIRDIHIRPTDGGGGGGGGWRPGSTSVRQRYGSLDFVGGEAARWGGRDFVLSLHREVCAFFLQREPRRCKVCSSSMSSGQGVTSGVAFRNRKQRRVQRGLSSNCTRRLHCVRKPNFVGSRAQCDGSTSRNKQESKANEWA